MENVTEILKNLFIFFCVYSSICGVISIISLWKIFIKENLPGYFSIIPFYNVYLYYKICSLPFWTIFFPGINIICLFCSTYVITRKYKCKRWQSVLSIFFPWFFMPYIAFSNRKNIDFIVDDVYVKNIAAIDKLEKKLETDGESDFDFNSLNSVQENTVANENNLIDDIEENIVADEYIFDDIEEIKEFDVEVPSADEFDNNEFVEIDDTISIDNLSLENVDNLEKRIEIESSAEKKIETDIQEYKGEGPSEEAIAFGGKQKIENVDSVQTKNDSLKCSRCGSSLVGANGYCPGCGMKI